LIAAAETINDEESESGYDEVLGAEPGGHEAREFAVELE
jgi:hypothetical protein